MHIYVKNIEFWLDKKETLVYRNFTLEGFVLGSQGGPGLYLNLYNVRARPWIGRGSDSLLAIRTPTKLRLSPDVIGLAYVAD